MTGAGILAGDLVLLDRSRTPKDGDIVLAEVDGVSTMKYFRKRGSHVYLEAASPKYKPMVPWICSHDTGHMWEASSPQPVLTWFMRLQKEF
jgi:SOS-response transcriptional repressor LexA